MNDIEMLPTPHGDARRRSRGRARHRTGLVLRSWLLRLTAVAAAGAGLTPGVSAATPASTPPPSAIGTDNPSWVQVAPNYQRTGLVLAVSTASGGCKTNCVHLWVSRDGGATWHRAKASGWDGGRPVIAVDSRGHDILLSSSSAGVLRSDDAGDTWVVVGSSGTPTVSPTYTKDGGTVAVAVPGGTDYLLRGTGPSNIAGSGGSLIDMGYAYAPSFPRAGNYAPVLLTAEDKKQRLPVIQQCSASYVCSGSTTLAGAVYFSSPITLLPSTTYASDGTVFAQSGRGIYKSTNGGVAFTPIPLGDPSATATATPMMALAPGYSEQGSVKTAWAAVFQIFQNKTNPQASHAGGGIYRTDDGGTTWRALDSPGPFDGGAMAVTAAPDGRLFAGYLGGTTGNSGLLCSTDGGNTWQAACPAEGSAANDPGPLPGSVHVCTTCTPVALSTSAANGVSPSGSPAAGAKGTVDGLSGGAQGGTGGSAGIVSTSTHPLGAGRPWAWIALAVAIVLAGVGGLSALRQRRRRLPVSEDV